MKLFKNPLSLSIFYISFSLAYYKKQSNACPIFKEKTVLILFWHILKKNQMYMCVYLFSSWYLYFHPDTLHCGSKISCSRYTMQNNFELAVLCRNKGNNVFNIIDIKEWFLESSRWRFHSLRKSTLLIIF